MTNVFVIGLGLIGGSFALDIKSVYGEAKIYGIDTNEDHLNQAVKLGLIDSKAAMEDLSDAEVVIVAVPVNTSLKLLPEVLDLVGDDTVVFDAGSTKSLICEAVATHPKRRNFLAAHPIAGTEFSGPSAALEGLYRIR